MYRGGGGRRAAGGGRRRRRVGGGGPRRRAARPERRRAEGGAARAAEGRGGGGLGRRAAEGSGGAAGFRQPDGVDPCSFARSWVLSENEGLGEKRQRRAVIVKVFRPGSGLEPGRKTLWSRLEPPTGTKDLPFGPGSSH